MAKQTAPTPSTAPPPRQVTISAPKFENVIVSIIGTSWLVQNRFSHRLQEQIRAKQEAGSTARGKKERVAKDFDLLFREAAHRSTEGWYGAPAPAFRNAMISACRVVGYKMTLAKLSIFVEADGYDEDGTPLVRLLGDPMPTRLITPVRLETGVIDLRSRAKFEQWRADVRIRYDADQFTTDDVVNLMMRVGMQVGIGEGRPDSKQSSGMGWGLFALDPAILKVNRTA